MPQFIATQLPINPALTRGYGLPDFRTVPVRRPKAARLPACSGCRELLREHMIVPMTSRSGRLIRAIGATFAAREHLRGGWKLFDTRYSVDHAIAS